MAALADRYDLYLRSVQSPENEVYFFNRAYKAAYGGKPSLLREDFCGTAAVCYEWVKGKPDRRAIGVDLDPEPLAWGTEHVATELSEKARDRVTLLQADARAVSGPKADVVAAQNFSFYYFHTRDDLRRYFRAAYRNLAKKGVLVLDVLGGPECMEEGHEETKSYRGFKYIWEQKRFDPITHECEFVIHFHFPDGSKLHRAFVYDWRLWTIPEIRELLAEAGFKRSDVYWEGTDAKTGQGNDVYRRREHAESDQAFVAYIAAIK